MAPARGRGRGAGKNVTSSTRGSKGGRSNTPRVQRDRSAYAGPGFSEIPKSAVDQGEGEGSDEGSDGALPVLSALALPSGAD